MEGPALGPAYSLAGASPPKLTATQAKARDAIIAADRPENYESIGCTCGTAAGDRLLSEVDRHGLVCRYVICLGCGLIRLTPRWNEARYRQFYETEYRVLYNASASSKATYARDVAANRATVDRATWIRRAAERNGAPARPRLVEIGAGGGWNLAQLPESWARVGYDVDQEYLGIGRAAFRADLRPGFVDEALNEIESADIVLLSHVVEHLSCPSQILKTIARRLRQGTLLLIEVPGIFSIHRKNLDVRSYLQNAHTFTYCAPTLQNLCLEAGLEVLDLDETARAVCRPGTERAECVPVEHPGLAERIITYLRRCDVGYRQYRRVKKVPLLGKYLAYGLKRTYFPAVGLAATWSGKQ